MSLNEFQLISQYFKSAKTADDVLLGIGDDAAILQLPDGHRLAVSSDTLVESVHFPSNAPADLVARRALRVNLSDLAAMAAQPRWFTLALTLPAPDAKWLKTFSSALHEEARLYRCSLVGGDTTSGALNIGIQIMGSVESDGHATKRSGAKPGDYIVVTGTLGDAAGALGFLDDESGDSDVHYLQSRYWLPEPRVEFAQKARSIVNAACDISDGLLADLGHICEASGVSAKVNVAEVPVSDSLKKLCGSATLKNALAGGDDYELCMAVSPDNYDSMIKIAREQNLVVTVVGTFNAGEGVECFDKNGAPVSIDQSGYQHFL